MAEKKSGKSSSGFTKEEELLLNDFSRNVSTKSSALFYGNAFIVSAIPICKYISMDNQENEMKVMSTRHQQIILLSFVYSLDFFLIPT